MIARILGAAATALIAAFALGVAPRAAWAKDPEGVSAPLEPTLHVDLGNAVALDLVLVPAGKFVQGSPPGEKGREADETQREVELTQPYYLGKVPVTVGQFRRFVQASGYRTEAEHGQSGGFGWDGKGLVQRKDFTWSNPGFPQTDENPVTLVTYGDALAFAAWASRAVGRAMSLPTEAQWEHAYRAGASTAYYAAATDKDALALGWFKENAGRGTYPVGKKMPNLFGLYDMAGNVFEWCLDGYAPYPRGPAVDPVSTTFDPSDKPRRVLRGGSWLRDVHHGRAAARYRNTPGTRNADNGFRVVAALALTAPPTANVPAQAPEAPASQPARVPPPPSGGHDALGVVMPLALVGGVVLFLVMAFRRGGRTVPVAPAPRVATPRPPAFRPSTDGFRIMASRAHAGWTLHYRFEGPTGLQDGQVILEPSDAGQFVYTGFVPVGVRVVNLIAPPHVQPPAPARVATMGRAPARQVVVSGSSYGSRSSSVAQYRQDDDGFRGFPPAY